MESLMTQEESYAERRQLFKNIWDTAVNLDDQNTDIMNKPKVIKTLRLDEVDRCVIGKKKKQRIKNLRTVCNKILDFCDRQDADDKFYQKVSAENQKNSQQRLEFNPKKPKRTKVKRRIKKIKNIFSPPREVVEVKNQAKLEDIPRTIAQLSIETDLKAINKYIIKSNQKVQKVNETPLLRVSNTSRTQHNLLNRRK